MPQHSITPDPVNATPCSAKAPVLYRTVIIPPLMQWRGSLLPLTHVDYLHHVWLGEMPCCYVSSVSTMPGSPGFKLRDPLKLGAEPELNGPHVPSLLVQQPGNVEVRRMGLQADGRHSNPSSAPYKPCDPGQVSKPQFSPS